MAAVDAVHARFDSGRVVRHGLALLKRGVAANLAWSVAFAGLPDLAMTYASQHFSDTDAPFGWLATWGLLAGTMLASMFGLAALQAVIAGRAARNDGDRHARSFGGLSNWLALGALTLITSLGIVAGFFLLIIPGIILSLAWLVVVPAMVTERLGVMDSIRRSNALTGEARGAVFGLWVALGLVGGLAAWLVSLVVDAVGTPGVALVVNTAFQAIIGLVNAVFAVAVYQELRWRKEGSPSDQLVEVFA